MTDKQFINPNEDTRIAQGSRVSLHFEVSLDNIAQGSRVSLHFEVSLDNGTVIDSTFDREQPVSLTIGDESLLEGFEKVLMNLRAGDTRTAHLEADQA